MSVVAIIPARGGSKRIPGKNLKEFLGKPIIQYSIEAALKSGIFEEVMVSTNDERIAETALRLGASVPFMRSQKNSDDQATTAQVIEEVLQQYAAMGRTFEVFFCIYPTAPFITYALLSSSLTKLLHSESHTLVPVVRYSYPIWRSLKMNEANELQFNWPENLSVRSQDMPVSYHDAGQFYAGKTEFFLKEKQLFTSHTMGIELPATLVQDIDTEEDWKMAELKMKGTELFLTHL